MAVDSKGDGMTRRRKLILVCAAAAVLGAGGAAIATGTVGGGDDGDEQATGPGADRAKEAALAITGGTANAVERDSEDGATWEVEVTKPDGGVADVRLDENYQLVVVEDEGAEDDGAAEDENEKGEEGSE
jgi:hypothetical protein